jgi:ATP-binding cassette subfamily A (ABC1) protein 1
MDAYSRRFAWGYIRAQKPGRTIVLTSHFMDEADLLSDRIAIMTRGRLACCGSPLFLKSRLGLGHHLTLLLAPSADADTPAALEAVLQRHAPGSVCEAHLGAELGFLLPPGTAAAFPALLRELDADAKALHVASYAISCSTLEEVFLSIAENATEEMEGALPTRISVEQLRDSATARKRAAAENRRQGAAAAAAPKAAAAEAVGEAPLVTGWALVAHQFWALLRKRALNARRDRLAWATQYVVPMLFVALGLALSHISASAGEYPAALFGPSFLANKPLAAAAAPGASASDAFAASFDAPGLAWARGADSVWNCSMGTSSSGVPSSMASLAMSFGLPAGGTTAYCEPEARDCAALGCTPAGAATEATLDAALLRGAQRHKNCRQAADAACAAVFFAAPPAAPASPRTFAFTLAASPDAFHALPAAQSAAHSAAYSALLGRPARLAVLAHPLPDPAGGRMQSQSLVLNLLVGLCVVLALGSLSASASVFLVAERRGHAKHLQAR